MNPRSEFEIGSDCIEVLNLCPKVQHFNVVRTQFNCPFYHLNAQGYNTSMQFGPNSTLQCTSVVPLAKGTTDQLGRNLGQRSRIISFEEKENFNVELTFS